MPKAYLNNRILGDIEVFNNFWNKFKPDNQSPRNQEKWREQVPYLEQISSQNCVLVLLWDVTSGKFIYAVDKRNVSGYEMQLYTAPDGINFSMSKIHPDFLTGALLMQQKSFDYILQNKIEDRNKVVVNFDGKYKKANGEYIHFLQQSVCIEFAENGHPLLFLSYIHDITYIKKDRTSNLVITAPQEVKIWNFNFDNQLLEEIQPLSKQEKKVLAFLVKGKNSKDIAKQLFVSSHTIDTHRRNLLKKTNCQDTSGLVTYAKLVGLF